MPKSSSTCAVSSIEHNLSQTQTDRQTDRQSDCIYRARIASRALKSGHVAGSQVVRRTEPRKQIGGNELNINPTNAKGPIEVVDSYCM